MYIPIFQSPNAELTNAFSLLKSKDILKTSTPLVPEFGMMLNVSYLTPKLSNVAAPDERSTIDVV